MPVILELVLVEVILLQDVPKGSAGKLARDYTILDRHGDAVFTIVGMKVRRGVVAVVHRDDNPKKAADLWHC